MVRKELIHRMCSTHMEKVKKLAPMVGLTLEVNELPTWRSTKDVLPTPACKN